MGEGGGGLVRGGKKNRCNNNNNNNNKDFYSGISVGSWRFTTEYFRPNYINNETQI